MAGRMGTVANGGARFFEDDLASIPRGAVALAVA